jgi:predicted dehydrogenase
MSMQTQQAKYGVLLVAGAQTHQENYARAFAADPRCQLIAVSDEPGISRRRRELNERLARELDLPYLAILDEALARDDVQVVSICAEPERRGAIAVKCARAGKHLYLDKSLAPRLSDADAIVQAVREANVRSHMFSFITQPWAKRASIGARLPNTGDLLAIHADVHFAKARPGTADLSIPRREQHPPDVASFQRVECKREMDNTGVYGVSLVRWIAQSEVHTVFCHTANYFFAEHQRQGAEDFGTLLLTFENGLHGTVSSGRIGWTSHPASGTTRVVVVGTKLASSYDPNTPRIEVYNDQSPWTPPPVNPADPMGFWTSTQQEVHTIPKTSWQPLDAVPSDASYFLDCLDAGRESDMSAANAAKTTEILLAGYQSAATGEVVELPLNREKERIPRG